MTPLIPYNQRLLIVQDQPRTSHGAIAIPEAAQRSSCKWTVVAVSKDLESEFKVGDRLYVPSFAGVTPILDPEDFPDDLRRRTLKLITRSEIQGLLPPAPQP